MKHRWQNSEFSVRAYTRLLSWEPRAWIVKPLYRLWSSHISIRSRTDSRSVLVVICYHAGVEQSDRFERILKHMTKSRRLNGKLWHYYIDFISSNVQQSFQFHRRMYTVHLASNPVCYILEWNNSEQTGRLTTRLMSITASSKWLANFRYTNILANSSHTSTTSRFSRDMNITWRHHRACFPWSEFLSFSYWRPLMPWLYLI